MGEELTFGEKAVGLTFNPSGDSAVTTIKKYFAQIIDDLNSLRSNPAASDDAKRLFSIAITEAQGAQMWAVKAITYDPLPTGVAAGVGASTAPGADVSGAS